MPAAFHQGCLIQDTLHATEEILSCMPPEPSPVLEQAARRVVRQAVAHCAPELDTLARPLHRFDCGKARL
jgi:hypothetical protein